MIPVIATAYLLAAGCWFVLFRRGWRFDLASSCLLSALWPIPAAFLLIVSSFEVLDQ